MLNNNNASAQKDMLVMIEIQMVGSQCGIVMVVKWTVKKKKSHRDGRLAVAGYRAGRD